MSAFQEEKLPAGFNRLAWSNLAAQSAEQVALAATPIVAVLLLGAGEGQTGLLQTALTLPFVLFAIPAGLMVDRLSRRWLMAGAEALRAAALLAILALVVVGWLTLRQDRRTRGEGLVLDDGADVRPTEEGDEKENHADDAK